MSALCLRVSQGRPPISDCFMGNYPGCHVSLSQRLKTKKHITNIRSFTSFEKARITLNVNLNPNKNIRMVVSMCSGDLLGFTLIHLNRN